MARCDSGEIVSSGAGRLDPFEVSGLITASSVVGPTQASSGLEAGRAAGSTETTNRAEPSVKTWPSWMIEAPAPAGHRSMSDDRKD